MGLLELATHRLPEHQEARALRARDPLAVPVRVRRKQADRRNLLQWRRPMADVFSLKTLE